MKISCDIIRDILPLYAEDMVSEATKEMVDDHLRECDECTKELGALMKNAVPVEIDTGALKRVGDSIRRRRILAVMAVFLFTATVLIGGALLLDARIYLSAGEAVEDIYVEGNTVKILWDEKITGTSGSVDTEASNNYAVTAWTNLHNILFPKERLPYDQLDEEVKALITEEQYAAFDNSSSYSLEDDINGTNFWYVDPSENSYQIILNAQKPFPEGTLMEVYVNTAYYVFGLAALCIFCMLLGMFFKNKWFGEALGRISILFGSAAISAMIVTAGQFASTTPELRETIIDSSAVALPMTLFALCVRQIMKLNKQDKGL